MSTNFSAEQYENPFVPHRLQNWQIPAKYPPKTPKTRCGFTQAVADNKGSVIAGVQRGNNSPWGNFVGTWDMPTKLAGPRQHVPTARSAEASRKLVEHKQEANFVLSGRHKSMKDHHPLAGVELPECYPRVDQKKLLKAAQCARPAQAEQDAQRREQAFSNQFEPQQDRQNSHSYEVNYNFDQNQGRQNSHSYDVNYEFDRQHNHEHAGIEDQRLM